MELVNTRDRSSKVAWDPSPEGVVDYEYTKMIVHQ